MDEITTALIAALGKLAEPPVKDAYKALKTLLADKFGRNHPKLPTAITDLEDDPVSKGRQLTLSEEVARSGAAGDKTLLDAAETLRERIKSLPGGNKFLQDVQQTVIGHHNIVAGGDANVDNR
jgi:hypothetical protein